MKEGIIVRDKCPICDCASSKTIFNRSFNEDIIKKYMEIGYQGNADTEFLKDVSYEIVKCNKCKLSYQKYVLDNEKLNELYNKWIDSQLALQWNQDKKSEYKHHSFIFTFVKKYLKKQTSEIKVLDYGAGFGDLLILATEMGFDAYAYEYSTERIRFLESKGIKIIDNNSNILFDFIIINQVFEHLTYPKLVLNEVISKLNKNGIVYFAVPSCPYIENQLKKTDDITDPKELQKFLVNANVSAFQHINFFFNTNLKFFLQKNGMKLILPIRQAFIKPISLKSFIRPFYNYYFRTNFFLIKKDIEN